MFKIGVIGDYESICGFAALGLEIYTADNAESAREQLLRLVGGEHGIIYITEQYAMQLDELIESYRQAQVPAIIPIPDLNGTNGFATNRVRRYVEQAVGSDIIFNDEG